MDVGNLYLQGKTVAEIRALFETDLRKAVLTAQIHAAFHNVNYAYWVSGHEYGWLYVSREDNGGTRFPCAASVADYIIDMIAVDRTPTVTDKNGTTAIVDWR